MMQQERSATADDGDNGVLVQLRRLLPVVLAKLRRPPNAPEQKAIVRWLEEDLTGSAPAGWEHNLQSSVDTALTIYRAFQTEFFTFFFDEGNGRGKRILRRSVEARFGRPNDVLV